MTVVGLFLVAPWVCLQFVIMVFPDHTHFFSNVCHVNACTLSDNIGNLNKFGICQKVGLLQERKWVCTYKMTHISSATYPSLLNVLANFHQMV